VLITIGSVTLVVVITVCVLVKVIEGGDADSESERCRQVREACYVKCSQTALPTGNYGAKFRVCVRECEEAEDCWGVK